MGEHRSFCEKERKKDFERLLRKEKVKK